MSAFARTCLLAACLAALPLVPVTVFAAERLPAELGDITLTNGKAYRAVVVLSQTSGSLNIRHAGGLTKIEKSLLPPELQARFPVDEALAAEEEKKRVEAERKAANLRRAQELQATQRRLDEARKASTPVTPPPATPAKPANDPRTMAVREATPAEQLARAPRGLYIVTWSTWSGSEVTVTVKNPTSSPQRLDPRQLTGLVLENGQSVNGTEIKYQPNEVASDWVDPGKERRFRVVFPGGFKLAAIAWTDSKEWRVSGPYVEALAVVGAEEAIRTVRENAAAQREQARASASKSAADYAKKESEKRLINK